MSIPAARSRRTGIARLSHPEPGFYTIGVKSYGRAPTFLLLTGYEQARSVAAAIAGDMEAADNVASGAAGHRHLPNRFRLKTARAAARRSPPSRESCCGGPAIVQEDACCVADEVAKTEGKGGCGCGAAA